MPAGIKYLERILMFLYVVVLAFLIYVVAVLAWNYLAMERLYSHLKQSKTKLLNILKKEPRYDKIEVNEIVWKEGILQCYGFVGSSNDYKSLTYLLNDFESNNIPVVN